MSLKDDLDLDMSPIKVSVLMRWIQMQNIKLLLCNRWNVMTNVKVVRFWRSIWTLTFKDDLDLDISSLKMCGVMWHICMPNIKLWPSIWPLTLKDDLDLDILPLKMCGVMWHICMPNIKLLGAIAVLTFNLTFGFEGLPWSWHFTLQNVQGDVTHMYAKYQVARCNSRILIAIGEKLWSMWKFYFF